MPACLLPRAAVAALARCHGLLPSGLLTAAACCCYRGRAVRHRGAQHSRGRTCPNLPTNPPPFRSIWCRAERGMAVHRTPALKPFPDLTQPEVAFPRYPARDLDPSLVVRWGSTVKADGSFGDCWLLLPSYPAGDLDPNLVVRCGAGAGAGAGLSGSCD